MAFERTRTINGRRYRYLEERWRVGKKIKSRSTYLGVVDEYDRLMEKAQRAADRAMAKVEKEQRAKFGETVEERQHRERAGKIAPLMRAAKEEAAGKGGQVGEENSGCLGELKDVPDSE